MSALLYDSKCHELAVHFFGEKDPRIDDLAQGIQDYIESIPNLHEDCECQAPEHESTCRYSESYDPSPYCSQCGPKSACKCPPHPEND